MCLAEQDVPERDEKADDEQKTEYEEYEDLGFAWLYDGLNKRWEP